MMKKYSKEIKEGYIYSVHFKAWDMSADAIRNVLGSTGIEYVDYGNKFGFKKIDSDRAKLIKELSDLNGSILFIDMEVPKEKYEYIEKEANTLLDVSTSIIEKLGLYKKEYKYNPKYLVRILTYLSRKNYSYEILKYIRSYLLDEGVYSLVETINQHILSDCKEMVS